MGQGSIKETEIYASLPGGPDLLAYFGVPKFHDAEIISLTLNTQGPSFLKLKTEPAMPYSTGHKPAVITFELHEIYDLQLDGFSRQNVIYGLTLAYAVPKVERQSYYTLKPSPMDIEMILHPCYGMDGVLRCKRLGFASFPYF